MGPQCAHIIWFLITLVAFFTLLHYVFSYASSKRLNKRMQSHNSCSCLPFLNFVSSCFLTYCRRYYEADPSRLGQKLPKPRIKHTKKIGETLLHKLSWGDEAGGEWLEDDWFQVLSENLTSESTNVSCNTRKSRDKRERRHTVGVFLGAFPCGIIVIGKRVLKGHNVFHQVVHSLKYVSTWDSLCASSKCILI